MGVSSISGSLTNKPIPHQENERVVNAEFRPGDARAILPNQPEIYNTKHNATALRIGSDDAIVSKLAGFISGAEVKVIWYNQITSRGDFASNFSTPSFGSDSVNTSYLRINDMGIVLSGPIDFEYDTDTTTSTVSGTALVFPGFQPKVGDLFVYAIDKGVIGLFKVNETPERLSIKSGTSHSVNFTLIKIMDSAVRESLDERTRETAYFNKERFLLSDGALLTHQEVIDHEFITRTIEKLKRHYSNEFFDAGMESVVRPDGVYDPYLVEFLHDTSGAYLNDKYVIQLFTDKLVNYNNSIFSKLLDRDNIDDLINTVAIEKVTYSAYSGTINALLNKFKLTIVGDSTEPYFSSNVMSLNIDDYTPFDRVVTLLLEYGVISYLVLKDLAATIRNEDPMVQFYQIPIIIYLLKLLANSIVTGESVKYITDNIAPYNEFYFTSEDLSQWDDIADWDDGFILEDAVLSVNLNGGSVVGVRTNDGTCLYPTEDSISIIDGITYVNMAPTMTEYNIPSVVGTWVLVVTNPLRV